MLLLNINMKPYTESPMTLSDLTLSDHERSVKVTQILSGGRYAMHGIDIYIER